MAERTDRLSFQFEAGAGKPRLDQFVAAKFPKISLTRIRRLIAEGSGQLADFCARSGVLRSWKRAIGRLPCRAAPVVAAMSPPWAASQNGDSGEWVAHG